MILRFLIILALLWLARQTWRRLVGPSTAPRQVATMVPCATCGSYVARHQAASALFAGKRRYFCDPGCLERYTRGERLDRTP